MVLAQIFVILVSLLGLTITLWKWPERYKSVILAAVLSGSFIFLSGIYKYTDSEFYSLNLLFPLFAWTSGLTLLERINDSFRKYKFIKTLIIYEVSLILVEFLFYNYFGVKLASNYPGLLGLPFMHSPAYAQVYYLIVGPIYLLLCRFMFENNAKSF